MKWTAETIRREVKRMDPALEEGDSAFLSACILIASVAHGPNVRRIARLLGVGRKEVAERGRRLRENGLWQGAKVAAEGWFDKDSGGVEFWLHVGVAEGLLGVCGGVTR